MNRVALADAPPTESGDTAEHRESADGLTPPSGSGHPGAFLTDVIVELGFADKQAVEEAVDAARWAAQTPEHCLLEAGAIDERQLCLARAERDGLAHVDLDSFEVDPGATGLIDKKLAARYTALPIAFAPDGALIVAIEDPCDAIGLSDIEVVTKSDVKPVLAAGSQLRNLIDRMEENVPEPYEPRTIPPDSDAPPGSAAPEASESEAPPEPLRPAVGPPPPAAGSPAPPEPESEPTIARAPASVPGPPPPPPPEPRSAPNAVEPPTAPQPPAPDGDPGELSVALAELQDRMRQAGELAEAAERRIGELEAGDDRARQAAAELEQAQRQADEREQQLQRELTESRERVAALQRRLSDVSEAAELARSAAEKLASLGSADD